MCLKDEHEWNADEKKEFLQLIRDKSAHMDEQSVNHLFDRYYRGTSTDVLTGGTGLGMAIVKQIVTAHQGTVDVKSKIDKGTSIIVILPMDGLNKEISEGR